MSLDAFYQTLPAIEPVRDQAYELKKTIRVIPYAKSKNVHPAQIRNWIRKGILPAIVIGRTILLDPEECDRALARFKQNLL